MKGFNIMTPKDTIKYTNEELYENYLFYRYGFIRTEFQKRIANVIIKFKFPDGIYKFEDIYKDSSKFRTIGFSVVDTTIDRLENVFCDHTCRNIRMRIFKDAGSFAYPKNMFFDIYFNGNVFNYTAFRGEKMLEYIESNLKPRDVYILDCYYNKGMTSYSIALQLGVTRERVNGILQRIRNTLLNRSAILALLSVYDNETVDDDIDDVYYTDVYQLNISREGHSKLLNAGIYILKTLCKFTKEELRAYIKLNDHDIDIIENELGTLGIQLKTYDISTRKSNITFTPPVIIDKQKQSIGPKCKKSRTFSFTIQDIKNHFKKVLVGVGFTEDIDIGVESLMLADMFYSLKITLPITCTNQIFIQKDSIACLYSPFNLLYKYYKFADKYNNDTDLSRICDSPINSKKFNIFKKLLKPRIYSNDNVDTISFMVDIIPVFYDMLFIDTDTEYNITNIDYAGYIDDGMDEYIITSTLCAMSQMPNVIREKNFTKQK
jgi:DNA-binding CsgD family transcriptional regulator